MNIQIAVGLLWAGLLTGVAAEVGSDREMRTRDRQAYEVIVGDYYTGRSPYFRPGPRPPVPAPRPVPRPVPAAPGQCTVIDTGLVHLAKAFPPDAALGQPFTYELKPTAVGCAANVVVTDEIPAGASLVGTDPQAVVQGDRLTWNLGTMDPGESRTLRVTLRPDKEGVLRGCATVSADPRACAQALVGKAALAVEKSGPETAILGSDLSYRVTVRNTGTAVARGVVVRDEVPAGLGGGSPSFPVGDLAPGASRTFPVPARASERGRFCNVAVASATNAGEARAEACTTVVKPGLKLTKTGDAERFLLKPARYEIVAQNTGDTDLTGVTVTDNAPAGTRILDAPGASVTGGVATWTVGNLKAGESKTFTLELTSPTAGRLCNVSTVTSTEGLRDTAEACTLWKGISAVLLEVVDEPDPLQVGEQTVYTIRITNQGNADLLNLNADAQFQKEMTPVSSQGGAVDGKSVRFPAVPRLAPKQSLTYTVTAKAVEVGDHRLVVTLTEDQLLAPVKEEESTRVY